ncbi:hypothetical protein GCM10020331_097970 [Ectobacillus funiculus]
MILQKLIYKKGRGLQMGIIEKNEIRWKEKFFLSLAAQGELVKSVATAFAEAGADLAIVDLDLDEAKKDSCRTRRKTMELKRLQLKQMSQKQEDVDAMIEEILNVFFGRLDVAFCNAGICMNIPAEEMTYDQWKKSN